jgi:hypothetical protein
MANGSINYEVDDVEPFRCEFTGDAPGELPQGELAHREGRRIGWITHEQVAARRHIVKRFASIR